VLQEYCFSRSGIHFGSGLFFFLDCSSLHACETHPSGLSNRVPCAMSSAEDDSYLPSSTEKPSLSGHGWTGCREIASEEKSPNDFATHKGLVHIGRDVLYKLQLNEKGGEIDGTGIAYF
jgi:hypothetical protein